MDSRRRLREETHVIPEEIPERIQEEIPEILETLETQETLGMHHSRTTRIQDTRTQVQPPLCPQSIPLQARQHRGSQYTKAHQLWTLLTHIVTARLCHTRLIHMVDVSITDVCSARIFTDALHQLFTHLVKTLDMVCHPLVTLGTDGLRGNRHHLAETEMRSAAAGYKLGMCVSLGDRIRPATFPSCFL